MTLLDHLAAIDAHDADLGNTVAGVGNAGGFEIDDSDALVQERQQHRQSLRQRRSLPCGGVGLQVVAFKRANFRP